MVYLKAEAWEKDYGEYDLPLALNKYMFKAIITKIHSDGSYEIQFDIDGTKQSGHKEYFKELCCDTNARNRRFELTADMLESDDESNEKIAGSEEEEGDQQPKKSVKKVAQPRGRSRLAKKMDAEDSSAGEEEDEIFIARDLDIDDDDDPTVQPEYEFSGINEDIEHVAEAFDSSPPGGIPKHLNRFEGYTPYRIFVHLFMKILERTVACTNNSLADDVKRLTVGELMVFISLYMFMGIVKLPSLHYYWNLAELGDWIKFPNWREKMTRTRFNEIKTNLRFEDYDLVSQETRDEDKAWKIRAVLTMLQRAFQGIMSVAGRCLSADEAMVRCCSRFPLRRLCPNKPIKVGAKFYCLVDYATKICINITLCDGIINSDNSQGIPWGAAGRRIVELVQFVKNRWHRLYTDNYYTSIPLARELLRMGIYLCGTMRSNMIPFKDLKAQFGTSKKPKPSRQNPKGKWASVYVTSHSCAIHAVMDSSLVYILDTECGSRESQSIHRRQGEDTIELDGPKALNNYNRSMGGVDQWDQLRTNRAYSIEQVGKSSKWTVTLFLSFISMAASNAFCIYKFCNPYGCDSYLDHTQFTMSLIKALYENCYDTRESRSTPGSSTKSSMSFGHTLKQSPPDSRQGVSGVRRRHRGVCRHCGEGTTTFACVQCCLPLHPGCFGAFHATLAPGNIKPDHKWSQIFEDMEE